MPWIQDLRSLIVSFSEGDSRDVKLEFGIFPLICMISPVVCRTKKCCFARKLSPFGQTGAGQTGARHLDRLAVNPAGLPSGFSVSNYRL